jgi:nucleoporin POM152
MNPSGGSFCLLPKQPSPLIVPIRLNGTTPKLIQYSHTTFTDPPVVHHHDILGRPLQHMVDHAETSDEPGEEKLLLLPFQITEVGAYKLERVVDDSKNDVRIYRSEAVVVECPSADISSFNEEGHFCQGETDALKVTVRGVPPLHVQYAQIVNGHPLHIPIDSIYPESFTSPLLVGDANQQIMRKEDYSYAQAHSVTLTYPLNLDTVGLWRYALLEVKDALGNTVSYEDAPIGYAITVYERPQINLRGCSEDNPIKVLKGRDTNLYFNIHTTDTGPFNVSLGYAPSDSSDPPMVETYNLGHKRDGLSITEPGIYSIVDISTKYCSGDVLTPQSCLVITPSEPTLQIEWSTLKDHCSGTVGVTADLTFTGEPPFHLSYRTLSKNTNQQEVKRIKVDRTRYQLDFKPEVAGTYAYEFIALDDVNYRYIELNGEIFSHEATIHPLPGVKFQDTSVRKTCIGSPLDVPIRMIGSGPWNLTYDIVEGNGRRQTFSTSIEQTETTLYIPGFQKGGKGTVSLRSVIDGGGCKVQLGEEDLVVEVRREKPSAKFYGQTIQGRDGDLIKIPLRLTGDGPWRIQYAIDDPEGSRSEHEAVISDPNGALETKIEGTYELLSVVDSSCPGVVKPDGAKFKVQWVTRPKVDIVGSEGVPRHEIVKKPDICAGQDAYLDLTLHGSPPLTFLT